MVSLTFLERLNFLRNGVSSFLAEFIIEVFYLLQITFADLNFVPINDANCVYHEMVVETIAISVSSNKHLKPFPGGTFFCQFDTYCMNIFRCAFSRCK